MKKVSVAIFIILLLLTVSACKETLKIHKIFKNHKLTLSNVNIKEENDYKTNKDIKISSKESKNLIKKIAVRFIELSYLDLDISDNKQDYLNLFSKDIQPSVKKQFADLTIGKLGKDIDSIVNADATINSLSVIWDKNNNPAIGLVDFKLTSVNYKSRSEKITGKAKGSLVMTKYKGKYKIIDYRIKNIIQLKKGVKKKSLKPKK